MSNFTFKKYDTTSQGVTRCFVSSNIRCAWLETSAAPTIIEVAGKFYIADSVLSALQICGNIAYRFGTGRGRGYVAITNQILDEIIKYHSPTKERATYFHGQDKDRNALVLDLVENVLIGLL